MSAETKKILVVDDEEDFVELLTFNLRRRGYRVTAAYDGAGALSAARRDDPDLILLDYMLPGMDGMSVLRCLRQFDASRRIPIVMVTARLDSPLIFEAVRCGVTDVMHKPFSMKDLTRWVEHWLSPAGLEPVDRRA